MPRFLRHRVAALAACILLPGLTSGCDKEARDFAEKTAALLRQRSAQLSLKIKAETKAYQDIAAIAAEASRSLVALTLRNERNARAAMLAADYQEGRKSVSRWQSELLEYGQMDYVANRELLASDVDASSRYLQGVQALKIEQDKVDALARLLAALAKQPTMLEDAQAIGAFFEDTKTAFDQKVCAQLEKQSAAGDKAAGQAFKAKGCTPAKK